MRTFRLIIGICITVILSMQSVSGQSRREREQKTEQAVKAVIDANHYIINVNYASLPKAGSVNLTSNYSLEIKNDSVFSHLPYFGRAYTVPYGGGGGLIFKESLINYTREYSKKKRVKITFTVKNNEDTYRYFITVFFNGSTSIHVNSTNRQPISFDGTLKLPADLD